MGLRGGERGEYSFYMSMYGKTKEGETAAKKRKKITERSGVTERVGRP